MVYRATSARLTREEEAAYWEDYRVVGRLFGLRRPTCRARSPTSTTTGARCSTATRLHVTDWARERARSIVLEPPVPWLRAPLVETVNFMTIALLPDRIRGEYGFAPLPPAFVRKALVRAGAEYVKRGVVPFLPGRLRLVPAARADEDPGWGAGTRTPITSSRGWRLAIRRPPKGRPG